MNYSDFDYTFTDKELQDLLGIVEQKATGAEGPEFDGLEFLINDAAPSTLGLQFQPHEASGGAGSQSFVSTESLSPSNSNPQFPALAPSAPAPNILPVQYSLPSLASESMTQPVGSFPPPSLPVIHTQQAYALPILAQQPQQFLPQPAPPVMHYNGAHIPAVPTGPIMAPAHPVPPAAALAPRMSKPMNESKPHISHSTVEKQRRDRINNLIDELRELVPPQASLAKQEGANSEARRPKHVVLADTIRLLKQFQTKVSLETGSPNNVFVKEEPGSHSEENSKGSSHEDGEAGALPHMPNIPIQYTQNSGVTVEKGPDCMYVQVKCRDRRGLLSDIINALKQLPLEIRTAAITTTGDGTVRDVFEVKPDDPGLTPAEVQNMVHDCLFQQNIDTYDHLAGKRHRGDHNSPA